MSESYTKYVYIHVFSKKLKGLIIANGGSSTYFYKSPNNKNKLKYIILYLSTEECYCSVLGT